MRALAVLAVICAHAAVPGLAGGFIGVDVFFVISGFLITRLLLAEIERTGRIDLLAFWARRARRLLPNAYAALLGTALLALLAFPGYSPAALTLEISFSALQVVNYYFADKAVDYFQAEAAASPVLHFWSLAVEEQFYMIWPVLLVGVVAAFRRSFLRAAAILLALVWCASFGASVLLTVTDQPLAYFGTGTRCWQLATGALLAFGGGRVEQFGRPLRHRLAWLGLAGILAGIVVIDESASYPGFWALIPTLGAACLLAGYGAAEPHGLLRRTLGMAPMQWLGARSYSWYLWHWPLLALPRIAMPDNPYIEVVAVPLSLAVACGAYAWVETPMRRGALMPARALPTLACAAAGLALIIGAAQLYTPLLLSIDRDLGTRIAAIGAASKDGGQAEKDGCVMPKMENPPQPDCLYGDVNGQFRAVLFGDSHAAHWFTPLNEGAKRAGWQLRLRSKSACPSADVRLRKGGGFHTTCHEWHEGMIAAFTGPDAPDLVVISNRMTVDYSGAIYDPTTGVLLFDEDARNAWKDGLRRTINRLIDAGVGVLVIRDVPRLDKSYEICLMGKGECATPRKRAVDSFPALDLEVAREFGARVVLADFTDELCSPTACPARPNGMIAFRDSNHLTATYAATYANRMTRYLQAFAAEKRRGQAEGLAGLGKEAEGQVAAPARGEAAGMTSGSAPMPRAAQ